MDLELGIQGGFQSCLVGNVATPDDGHLQSRPYHPVSFLNLNVSQACIVSEKLAG